MTKKELIESLKEVEDDDMIICMDETGGWDNILEIKKNGGLVSIVFGGGSNFWD